MQLRLVQELRYKTYRDMIVIKGNIFRHKEKKSGIELRDAYQHISIPIIPPKEFWEIWIADHLSVSQ